MKMTQFAKFANNATNQILGTSGLIRENLQSMFSYPNAINVLDPVTVSGNTIFITDGAPLNAKRVTIYIEPLQAGSGDPSPENIRPISGWAGANVIRTGLNMFGGLDFANSLHDASHISTIDTVNKTVTFDRYKNNSANTVYLSRIKQMTIILTYSNNGYNNSLQWIYSDGTYGEIRLNNTNGEKITSVFTSNASKNVIALKIGYRSESLTTIYYDETGLFANVVTADSFESYTGMSYNITFPDEVGTVYGGTLDIILGELIINKQYIKKKLSEGTKTTGEVLDSYLFNTPFPHETTPSNNSVGKICNICTYSYTNVTSGIPHFYCSSGGLVIYVPTGIDGDTEIEVCVPIVNPLSYQITPTNILMLNGINTVYSDCGSMELEYYRREGGGNPYV